MKKDEQKAAVSCCCFKNIICNFSFMPQNEVIMAQHHHRLETVFLCIEDHNTAHEPGFDELRIRRSLNLAVLLDLRTLSSSKPERRVQFRLLWGFWDLMSNPGIVQLQNCFGHLIINPENESFLPFAPQPTAGDAQAATVGAMYNLVEINMNCGLSLASEQWAIDRLLKVIKTLHLVPEVSRKAALILETLVSEPQNWDCCKSHLQKYILFQRVDIRTWYELTSRPINKVSAARGIWGM